MYTDYTLQEARKIARELKTRGGHDYAGQIAMLIPGIGLNDIVQRMFDDMDELDTNFTSAEGYTPYADES